MELEQGTQYIPVNGDYESCVVIDRIVANEVMFYPRGGGLLRKGSVEDFAQRFRPLEESDVPSEPKPALFELELLGQWRGYHYGDRWNGHAMPYFDRRTAQNVMEHITSPEETWLEDEEGFHLKRGDHPEEDGVYEKRLHRVDGEDVILAPVGAGEFTWGIVPEDEEPQ